MKKVALVIGLVALFASCGTSTTGTAPKADSTTVKKDTVITQKKNKEIVELFLLEHFFES